MSHNDLFPILDPGGAVEVDPVCGMKVRPETAAGRHEYRGKTYYFCNPRCLERFTADPERYLAPPAEYAGPFDGYSFYTCP
jgi:Cu+-exporting ATPase